MVVDSAGHFLSQRSHAVMALIAPVLQADAMTVHAPDMPPLEIATAPLAAGSLPTVAVQIWDDSVTFGINTILLEGDGEVLHIGQEIEVELAF